MAYNKIYIPNILIAILSIFVFPLCIISFFVYFVLFAVFFTDQSYIDTNYINI